MNVTTEDCHGHIIEQVIDHGDGTGTRTVYEDGQAVATEQVTGLPVPDPTEVAARTIEERLAADLAAMQAIIDLPNASFDLVALRKAVKDIARSQRRLIRTALHDYESAD